MDTLFHYTTATGLLGICTTRSIWASDLQFLNDAQEAVYGRDIVIAAIASMANPMQSPDHWAHEYGERAIETFEKYKGFVLDEISKTDFGVYVACFCESGDLLSQWRGYGSDHGYAIEITKDALQNAVGAIPTHTPATGLFKVRYGHDVADEVVQRAVEQVARFNLNHPGVKAHYSALAVNSMLAQIKHPGFAEEQEWRLVVGLEILDDEAQYAPDREPTKFRSTPIAIVPYLEIPLPHEGIASIRVGPGDNVDVREAGVRRLLRTLGINAVVTRSEVPLRA